MKYTIIGTPLYSLPSLITDDEVLESRNEWIIDDLLAVMHGTKTAIAVDVWGCKDVLISEGRPEWNYEQLSHMVGALAIKDGVDEIEYEDGCLGLVAYYNGRESYLKIITDPAEIDRIEKEREEAGEYDG